LTAHFLPLPQQLLALPRTYGPPRATRATGVDYGTPQDKKLSLKALRYLPNITQESTSHHEDPTLFPCEKSHRTCKLGIGPSQQYQGGEELYLAQPKCIPGKIITYYNGTPISKADCDSSTSRYIFEYPHGSNSTTDTGPDNGPTIIIDAIDPDCGYGRYSDDDLYQGGDDDRYVGTANADWRTVGLGIHTRLALVATREIRQGQPIRARYGWQYWYQPNILDIRSMRRAFLGYLHVIAIDPNHKLAMEFA
jgi:hypothetical protein